MKAIVYKVLILCILILCSITSNAYDFEVNGIYYKRLSNKEVEVTYKSSTDRGYSGSITIPETVEYLGVKYSVTRIGNDAFNNCEDLTGNLTIPNTVTYIGSMAFSGCSGLTGSLTIPNSVTTIGNYAFYGCSGFKGTLTISNSITSIGNSTFSGCSGFTGSLTIPNSVTSIGDFAFMNCSGFKASLSIPNSVINIGQYAFCGCSGFTGSLTIPNSVTTIGQSAFKGCSGFTGSLTISTSIKKIKDEVFYGCSGLTGPLTIPESVISIGNWSFCACKNLTGPITIPNSVSSIDSYAFHYCRNIERVNSKIETPFEIGEYAFDLTGEARTSQAILQVPKGTKNSYKEFSRWVNYFKVVIEEGESVPTYTLSITSTGNGEVTYDNTTIQNNTSSFTVFEGTDATIWFSPYYGYRIKSVKVNNTDVTSNVSNNKYVIKGISVHTSLIVEFEAIPPATYSLYIKSTGNGVAIYDGTTIRDNGKIFTVSADVSAVVSFVPDLGYRIKSVKQNSTDVTSLVINNQYTISKISSSYTLEVEFEEIPPTTYTLSLVVSGSGSVSCNGTTTRNQSRDFSVVEKSSVTLSLNPDNGYRVASVKMNNTDVTSQVSNNQFTINNISGNLNVEVAFEVIPPTTYTLTIKSTGNGIATYEGNNIRDNTSTFTVTEGTFATITFTPDTGYRIKTVTLDGTDITSAVINNQLTTSQIVKNTSVDVEFMEDISVITIADVNYKVVSYEQQTINLESGDYGLTLTVPATVTAYDRVWTVVGVEADALNSNLAAIIWNPEVEFNGVVSNPNLLLYVKNKQYAPSTIKNVVVNGEAEEITLVDAQSGNNFYCPQAFTAKKVSYEHHYGMTTGYNTCQGWETIVLPFDVATILNATAQEIVPYAIWDESSNLRTFWLYNLTASGWQAANSIKANTPYIISMPNNENYDASYNITGNIQFIGNNVQIKASDNLSAVQSGNKSFVPNYQYQETSSSIYALNVNNQWNTNTSPEAEGSTFIRSLRAVRPFEAYLTVEGGTSAPNYIPVFGDGMPTGIDAKLVNSEGVNSEKWYSLDGRKLQGKPTKKGLYIVNGRKVVVK